MIVKNGGKWLQKCFDALTPLREEIKGGVQLVVVDTGSTDGSAELGQEYADTYATFEWINDFGAARNEALKYCKGEWYFQLDADEVLRDPEELIAFFNSGLCEEYGSASILRKDLEKEYDFSLFTPIYLRNISRNTPYLHYSEKIHETFTPVPPFHTLKRTHLLHFGYIGKTVEVKAERNSELITEKANEKDLDELTRNKYELYAVLQLPNGNDNPTERADTVAQLQKYYDRSDYETKDIGNKVYYILVLARKYYSVGEYGKSKTLIERAKALYDGWVARDNYKILNGDYYGVLADYYTYIDTDKDADLELRHDARERRYAAVKAYLDYFAAHYTEMNEDRYLTNVLFMLPYNLKRTYFDTYAQYVSLSLSDVLLPIGTNTEPLPNTAITDTAAELAYDRWFEYLAAIDEDYPKKTCILLLKQLLNHTEHTLGAEQFARKAKRAVANRADPILSGLYDYVVDGKLPTVLDGFDKDEFKKAAFEDL
jgi:glycosyltransferase involved in cell wall biosynthesis